MTRGDRDPPSPAELDDWDITPGSERETPAAGPRDDAVAGAQDQPAAPQSVWETGPRLMQGSGEVGDTAQWAALPKRTPAPGARATGDDDEDER